MRLPRVRFTVRRLMVAVAVVAVLTVGWMQYQRLGRLSRAYQFRVIRHRQEKATWLESREHSSDTLERAISKRSFVEVAGYPVILGATDGMLDEMRKGIDLESRRVDYHGAMLLKYKHAARYPWLPVAPDPPEPR